MKISYNWLKHYIDLNIEPLELAKILTGIGLEVGGIEYYEPIKGGLKGLIIGEVKTCIKHPNADKLRITTVDIGNPVMLQIICGAPNVESGQKVVVATIGTTLFKGEDRFVIKESKIRGELSQGMICAEDEIGLGASHEGIMVLPSDVTIGIQASEFFNIDSDVIFEVDITPNRIDAASHIGVARDLAAFLKIPYKKPSVDNFKPDNESNIIKIFVENTEACPRYSGITISGVTITGSPDWLKNKLKSIGLNPINNIVDITNYILHETGQPLHAFDADKIKGKIVIIKTLDEGSSFVTLDGTERKLSAQDLIICNADEGMCIAGVYGGLHSGVNDNTKNIFLESAYFNPQFIRKTAKFHGLSTDASFRFERGTDPNITVYALKRAAQMIREIAGGNISSSIIDIYPGPINDFIVTVSYENITKLLGKKIEKEIIKNILQSLEIKISFESDTELTLLVPPYRVDVQREVDIIEEILRIYGYNNIEIPVDITSSLSFTPKPDEDKIVNIISDILSNNGFNEIMCNSLSKSVYYDTMKSYLKENLVIIMNPLSIDLDCMRQTLLFGGLNSIIFNINHKNNNLKFYEFGNCYQLTKNTSADVLRKYNETLHLAIFLTGNKTEQNWISKNEPVSFYQLKSYVRNILYRLGINTDIFEQKSTGEGLYDDIFSEGLILNYLNKEIIVFGKVNRKLLKIFDIDQEVFYGDFNWTNLISFLKLNQVKYSEIPKFPEVRRDLALLLDKQVTFEEIKNLAFKTEKKLLKKVSLFDVYNGTNLGENKKSYAVNFILQDEHKTLTDIQIEKIMTSLITSFEKNLNARIR